MIWLKIEMISFTSIFYTILYGLGYSAFGELDQKLSENRVEEINKDIMNFSSSYIKLWQPKK